MTLPRLLYVGDVPVESTIAGATLLYRLFDGYPVDRLVICQSDLPAVSVPQRRLAGVAYREFSLGNMRLLHSRLSGYFSAFVLARSGRRAAAVSSLIEAAPDAVVTVAHAFSWLTAARLARDYRVPLHLIVHDECMATLSVAPPLRAWAEARFRQTYEAAASRFCVSPGLRDYYLQRYGVGSDVLYPSRGKDTVAFTSPSSRVSRRSSPFTVAFAGSLNVGHLAVVEALTQVLDKIGGRLEIYTANPSPEVRSRLASPLVSFLPFVPSSELGGLLRERADLLLVPMSFDLSDAENMALCFPAKLADHTAMGIPILVVGPPYCSAVTWATDNPGVAEVVTDLSGAELSSAIRRLSDDVALRERLAVEVLRVGPMYFDHARAQESFFTRIAGPAVRDVAPA